ncbi:endolytic transglycosylase MltG [bacterium]|nr:endolytic transglycosylase MltG [bacterium]
MPPQPISNPAVTTISAVLNYTNTDYLYYLHDNSGVIHYGKTISEHNANKQKYLN